MHLPKPVVVGNWKMHGLLATAEALAAGIAERAGAEGDGTLVVCPTFLHLTGVAASLAGSRVQLGAQDCHVEAQGAFTGDVSAAMLADAGCRFVIVGHSERRQGHGESDALVRAKAEAAQAAGLVPIVCIGETEAEWLAGETHARLASQIAGSLPRTESDGTLIVAYEPVWAIGTGRTPTEKAIGDVHRHIRGLLSHELPAGESVPILYGGSVKPANAGAILATDGVDGALVGGASLKSDDFWAIYGAGRS